MSKPNQMYSSQNQHVQTNFTLNSLRTFQARQVRPRSKKLTNTKQRTQNYYDCYCDPITNVDIAIYVPMCIIIGTTCATNDIGIIIIALSVRIRIGIILL